MALNLDVVRNPPSSDELLTQLRLKVFRQLLSQLAERGLWIPRDICMNVIRSRKVYGNFLRTEILRPALGDADYHLLDSEHIFGVGRHRFATRLPPLMLAFGYDMGTGIHTLQAPGGKLRHKTAQLAALFLFGTSLFDRVCDVLKQDADVFHQSFDEKALLALLRKPAASGRIAKRAAGIANREVRILLRVICAFFSGLHRLNQVSYKSDDWCHVERSLVDAYRSEVQTSEIAVKMPPNAEALTASAKAWILPFKVISDIVYVSEPAHSRRGEGGEQLVECLASCFWIMDDLVDLAKDIRAGDSNSIILQLDALSSCERSNLGREIAIALLDGEEIAEAIERLCANLAFVQHFIQERGSGQQAESEFANLIRAYLLNWLPKSLFGAVPQ